MFTGIIKDLGEVTGIDKSRGDWRFSIKTTVNLDPIEIGASIACSGCCLTVIEKQNDVFITDVSAESLNLTTLGAWDIGTRVNIEPSLKLGDEMGGHIVSGHVDGLAQLISITPEGDSHRLKIKTPEGFARYIAPKGSVALDGISLTVNEVDGDIFGVNIIPHTWDVTTLGVKQAGDAINFEVDTMARYVARMIDAQKSA